MKEALAVGNITCAFVCAKWALELGFSQSRQLLALVGGITLVVVSFRLRTMSK